MKILFSNVKLLGRDFKALSRRIHTDRQRRGAPVQTQYDSASLVQIFRFRCRGPIHIAIKEILYVS